MGRKRRTQAEINAEMELRRGLARLLTHEQAYDLLRACEGFVAVTRAIDRYVLVDAEELQMLNRMSVLAEHMRIANSMREWLLGLDDEVRSSTQLSENDRSSTAPDRSSTQNSENDRSPTATDHSRHAPPGVRVVFG